MFRSYGYDVGLAFQIVDDLLDVTGDEAALGKKVGKDAAAGKATFVAALGVDGARGEARKLVDRAIARLDGFGAEAEPLRAFRSVCAGAQELNGEGLTMAVDTPHLDRVEWPRDLRDMSARELRAVADELRAEMVDAVSTTGGHLGAGLGVIELTVAIHHLFDTPEDILIWDVGHQCYPHKILTGRRDRIRSIRQGGGLSGFTSGRRASTTRSGRRMPRRRCRRASVSPWAAIFRAGTTGSSR